MHGSICVVGREGEGTAMFGGEEECRPGGPGLAVLLSAACPTSLASDQNKKRGGGRSGVQSTPRSGAESGWFDLSDKDAGSFHQN